MRGTGVGGAVYQVRPAYGRRRKVTAVANDFLTASAAAASDLEAARKQHAKLRARADARLLTAKDRHKDDLADAAAVEAVAWARLAEVTGMTVGTAARIGGTSEPTAAKWIKRGRELQGQSCN